jgi:hypothetical protein
MMPGISIKPRPDSRKRRRSTAARLDGYLQALSRRRRYLVNLVAIYRDQPAIFPEQITASLELLSQIRAVVNAAQSYITRIEPAETERIKPWPTITKLGAVDYHLTEILLHVAMFGPLCQAISPQRPRLHIEIRAAFPVCLGSYDDLLAQLSALTEKARQPKRRAGVGKAQREEARIWQ